MPLAAVTSVKCSVRVPSAATVRSLRNRRLFSGNGPAGCGFAALSGLLAEHLTLHDEDVEVAVVVVVEQRDAGRHDFRVVELA